MRKIYELTILIKIKGCCRDDEDKRILFKSKRTAIKVYKWYEERYLLRPSDYHSFSVILVYKNKKHCYKTIKSINTISCDSK